MIIQRNNKETLQFLKQIEWKKMSRTTLADEVECFFGAVKTKRTNTVESKIADYVKKEDQLRKFSKSARKVVVWDPEGESLLQFSGLKMLPSKA